MLGQRPRHRKRKSEGIVWQLSDAKRRWIVALTFTAILPIICVMFVLALNGIEISIERIFGRGEGFLMATAVVGTTAATDRLRLRSARSTLEFLVGLAVLGLPVLGAAAYGSVVTSVVRTATYDIGKVSSLGLILLTLNCYLSLAAIAISEAKTPNAQVGIQG